MILSLKTPTAGTEIHRTDEEILLAVRLERRLHSVILQRVRVHAGASELQLFGCVATWHEKQQAQELARSLAPAFHIRNELRVTRMSQGNRASGESQGDRPTETDR